MKEIPEDFDETKYVDEDVKGSDCVVCGRGASCSLNGKPYCFQHIQKAVREEEG